MVDTMLKVMVYNGHARMGDKKHVRNVIEHYLTLLAEFTAPSSTFEKARCTWVHCVCHHNISVHKLLCYTSCHHVIFVTNRHMLANISCMRY